MCIKNRIILLRDTKEDTNTVISILSKLIHEFKAKPIEIQPGHFRTLENSTVNLGKYICKDGIKKKIASFV